MVGFTLPRPLQVMGWLATAVMSATVVAMVATRVGCPFCAKGSLPLLAQHGRARADLSGSDEPGVGRAFRCGGDPCG